MLIGLIVLLIYVSIIIYFILFPFLKKEYEKFVIMYFLIGIWIPFIQRCFNFFLHKETYFIYGSYLLIPSILILPISFFLILKKLRVTLISFYLFLIVLLIQFINPIKLNLLGKIYAFTTTFTYFLVIIFVLNKNLNFNFVVFIRLLDKYLPFILLSTFLYSLLQYILGPNSIDLYWINHIEFHSLELPLPFLIRVFGPSNSPAALSFFFSISFIVSLVLLKMYKDKNRKYLFILLISIIGILITRVRSSLIGVILVFLFSLFFMKNNVKSSINKIKFASILVSGMFILVLVFNLDLNIIQRILSFKSVLTGEDVSLNERLKTWNMVINSIQENPFGYGLGSSGRFASDYLFRHIDNGYLSLGVELGVWGLLLFIFNNLFILIFSFVYHWKIKRKIFSIFYELVFYITLYFLIIMLFGDFIHIYIYILVAFLQGMFLKQLRLKFTRRIKS